MDESASGDETQVTPVPPERLTAIQAHARTAGLPAEITDGGLVDEYYPILRVAYPEGRESREITYDEDDAKQLLGVNLADIRFLPETQGFADTASNRIEVQVRIRNAHMVKRVPGYEALEELQDGDENEDVIEVRSNSQWRLAVERGGVRLELSPASDQFRAVQAIGGSRLRTLTLKIDGATHGTTDDALEVFRTLADAFFFDLDVRYNLVVDEMAAPHRTIGVLARRMNAPAVFPENRYIAQPASLYRYGRSAQGLPLLSFLAFYQVLEFFFPIFTQEEVTRRVKQTLRNPRFDSSDDVSVLKLVEAIRPTMKFGVSERDQLRAVLRRCLTIEIITDFISGSKRTTDHFCKRPQAIPGLHPLQLSSGSDLRDQVADRIYDIRCRIVHTKSDGGEGGVELLLPSGPEARSLAPDIALVRLAAQEALIAGASPLK